jgi:hypothetical protein
MDTVIILRSYLESIKDLPDDKRLFFWESIIQYGLNGVEPTVNGLEKSLWVSIKSSMDSNIRRYNTSVENGKKGGAPKGNKNAKKQPETTQNNPIQPKTIKNNLNKDKDKDMDISLSFIKDKDDIVEVEVFKTPFDIDYTSLGGYGKFLQTFPLTKHREIDLGKQIWDTFSQEEKQDVMRHSTMYVKDMTSKKQEMYMKNTLSYLESELWLEMKARSFTKKPVERGLVNMTFVSYFSKVNGVDMDSAQKYLYRESSDEQFSKAFKEYKEHTNKILKLK